MTRSRDASGAAAVEAALVLLFLMPLLGGLLVYGNYFWQAQKIASYAPRIPQSTITGTLSCTDLEARAESTVVALLHENGVMSATTDNVVATVVGDSPGQGVTINVKTTIPTTSLFSALLPNGGNVVTGTTQRLDDASVVGNSCGTSD